VTDSSHFLKDRAVNTAALNAASADLPGDLPQVPTRVVFRGVLPFMLVDCVRLAILIAFPVISLYLPSLMK